MPHRTCMHSAQCMYANGPHAAIFAADECTRMAQTLLHRCINALPRPGPPKYASSPPASARTSACCPAITLLALVPTHRRESPEPATGASWKTTSTPRPTVRAPEPAASHRACRLRHQPIVRTPPRYASAPPRRSVSHSRIAVGLGRACGPDLTRKAMLSPRATPRAPTADRLPAHLWVTKSSTALAASVHAGFAPLHRPPTR